MKFIEDKSTIPTFKDGELIYLEERLYRILSHQASDDDNIKMLFWLIDLSVSVFRVLTISLIDLSDAVAAGKLTRCLAEVSASMPELKAGDKAIADLRFQCIRDYVGALYPDYSVLSKRGRGKDTEALESLAKSCRLSVVRMRQILLLYLQSGGSYLSVVDGRTKRAMEKNNMSYSFGAVRGRKRNGLSNNVVNSEKLFAIFEEAFCDYQKAVNNYNYDSDSKHKPTLMSAYYAMIIKHFSKTEDGNIALKPCEDRPSYHRFYDWVRKYRLHDDYVRNHSVSARDRRNNNRLLIGTCDYGVNNLAEIVEIDENEASVILVSANPNTPGQVLGHAITYIAIDILSRRIMGASVGGSNNSYEGFLGLIDSMLMSDEENARIFGVVLDPSMPVFPGCTLPQEIRVDHGAEYTSKAITENLTGGKQFGTLEGLPIAINIVPVALGSAKGIVESFFKLLHENIQAALKSGMGYVTGTHSTKHLEEAIINIIDFRRIVYETIKYYNNSPIPNYPLTPSLLNELDKITPNSLWEYYSKTRICRYTLSDEDTRIAARYGFMKRDKSFSLSRKGISYKNFLYWDIGEDKSLEYKALQLGDGSMKVDIRYDPRSANTLYRYDPDTQRYFRYELAEKRPAMRAFSDMRWAMVDDAIKQMTKYRYEAKREKEDARIVSVGNLSMIADQAKNNQKGVINTITGRRDAAQAEFSALAAYDKSVKDEIFYGKDNHCVDGVDQAENINESCKVVPIEPPKHSTELVPTISINDPSAIAAAYGMLEDD